MVQTAKKYTFSESVWGHIHMQLFLVLSFTEGLLVLPGERIQGGRLYGADGALVGSERLGLCDK